MSQNLNSEAAEIAVVIKTENDRCIATTNGDFETLAEIIDDDLMYTHTDGRTEDKGRYIAGLQKKPRSISRSGLVVRVYGDVALATGAIKMTFEAPADGSKPRVIEGTALQGWKKQGVDWRLIACQVTENR